ncbi:MAG TPA: hypothetical protein VM925_17355, partial [Labilithrix sp.]|nr:hypothetical protein [Labilithrix sp.]
MRGSLVLALVVTTACGPTAPTSTSTSAAHSPPAVASANAAFEQRCLASFARNRPSSWTDVGRLEISLEDGRPTSITARDASGKIIETSPAPKSKDAARDTMRSLTCRLG